MEIRDLLPIGSIVLLKGATKKLMVFGVKQLDESNPEKEFDYSGVPYPEGNFGAQAQYLFDHKDIGMVCFRGFEDEERDKFLVMLDDYYKNAAEHEED